MKVSPECFIELSHRVKTHCTKERKSLLKVQAKRTGRLLRAQVKRDKGNIVNPGQKTGLIFFICILTSPGQEIGHTTRETSHLKLEITQAFSIVDRKFRQKPTTTMTSCNGWKKVREQR